MEINASQLAHIRELHNRVVERHTVYILSGTMPRTEASAAQRLYDAAVAEWSNHMHILMATAREQDGARRRDEIAQELKANAMAACAPVQAQKEAPIMPAPEAERPRAPMVLRGGAWTDVDSFSHMMATMQAEAQAAASANARLSAKRYIGETNYVTEETVEIARVLRTHREALDKRDSDAA